MHRRPLNSQTLRSAGYDPEGRVLEIEFADGEVYQYFGVPEFTFQALIRADSPGAYFRVQIRERQYDYKRVS